MQVWLSVKKHVGLNPGWPNVCNAVYGCEKDSRNGGRKERRKREREGKRQKKKTERERQMSKPHPVNSSIQAAVGKA